MSDDEMVPLARPDSPDAQKALSRRPRDSVTSLSLLTLCVFSFIYLVIAMDKGSSFYSTVAGISLGIFSLCVIADAALTKKYKAAHDKHLANGDIVYVHKHFFDVWDELRREAGVALTAEERHRRIPWLFDAAVDLRAELDAWDRYRDEPECGELVQLAEARIRARLVREVRVIQEEQRARMQLDALAPQSNPGGVQDEEVAEQLAVLRRRDQPGTTTPRDSDRGEPT